MAPSSADLGPTLADPSVPMSAPATFEPLSPGSVDSLNEDIG